MDSCGWRTLDIALYYVLTLSMPGDNHMELDMSESNAGGAMLPLGLNLGKPCGLCTTISDAN